MADTISRRESRGHRHEGQPASPSYVPPVPVNFFS
jgi:hypothetical protein